MKISRGILPRGAFHRPPDPDLPLDFYPIKHQLRERICVQVPALLAIVVRKKTKSAPVDSLQQNNTNRWFPIRGSRGQTHRVDITNIGGERGGEPGAELCD